ncbi:hypothetical protein [Photobacterium nomapromontoriensis]|uniref:hypothetical protein n=1 Tax=Photobacterium nomapromontoriensis TaxID=2910237 RepID=UPI003D0DB6D7
MSAKALKIVFYAINGTGLGHITRLNNIATDAAIMCKALGIEPRFEFITTSDAPAVVTDFITTKFPSKTTIKELALPIKSTTAAIKAQIVSHISTASPDALVLDTNPKGSYGEFSFIQSLARTTVFIDRARKQETIDASTKMHIALYDKVICPEVAGCASFPLHPNTTYTGKIHGYKPEKALTRESVREYFGVKPNQKLVYLSSGGGGDKHSEQVIDAWTSCVRDILPEALIVIGYGPLFKGKLNYRDRHVIPFTGTNISGYFTGFDFAISAAGYNSFEELQAAGVPTLFYSLEKGMDDQADRIRQKESEGFCMFGRVESLNSDLRRFLLNREMIATRLSGIASFSGSVLAAKSLIETAASKRSWQLESSELEVIAQRIINNRIEKNDVLTRTNVAA